MDATLQTSLLGFLPFLLVGAVFAIPSYLLAIEKGRNPWKWVILCLIPLVNIPCTGYFVGTPSSRLERKIDELLKVQGRA